jgi:molecular chaperone Hsp33
MKDYSVIGLAYNKEIRIYTSVSTHLVNEAQKIHQSHPTATAAFGRFLTQSAMMSLMYKDGERLTLKIEGDGPIGSMTVEAMNGIVRGFMLNPYVYIKYEDGPKKGKLNVGAAVGRGFIYVTRDWKGNYFTSSSPLQSGEIGDDFTYYYAVSEQTPSAVGLGVLVDRDSSVKVSGGFIVQVLPNASQETIEKVEKIIQNTPSVTDLLLKLQTPEKMLSYLADGTENILEKHEIKYECTCNKDKFRKSLMTLNIESLEEILNEDKKAHITCNFCKKEYTFDENELKKMLKEKREINE